MAQGDHDRLSKIAKAHSVFVRLALPPYTIHFNAPSYLQPHTLDLLDRKVCKETLKCTAHDSDIREVIGTDPKYWADLVTLLRAAVPSLERRSFAIWDPTSVDYESTSGALIAGHYPGLWRDLERLNDLISISRNVLTSGAVAQDLAADKGVEPEIFRLVNCCIRVAARGYDGDAGTGEEEKWQWVVNAYKKLLITTLQVLNNLVAQNEKRKLMLWASLFDTPSDLDTTQEEYAQRLADDGLALARPEPPLNEEDLLIAYGRNSTSRLHKNQLDSAVPMHVEDGFAPFPPESEHGKKELEYNAWVLWTKHMRQICIKDFRLIHNRSPTLAEIHLNLPLLWTTEQAEWEPYQQLYSQMMTKYEQDLVVWESQRKNSQTASTQSPSAPADKDVLYQQNIKQVEQKLQNLINHLSEQSSNEMIAAPTVDIPPIEHSPDQSANDTSTSSLRPGDDTEMLFTAEAGAKILESGKAELMKRLEGYDDSTLDDEDFLVNSRHSDRAAAYPARASVGQSAEKTRSLSRSPPGYRREGEESRVAERRTLDPVPRSRRTSTGEDAYPEDYEGEEEEESEEGEEDEDYPGSSEDGRGLLTDVPLILGPSEIEVLPMLIMSGLVPRIGFNGTKPHRDNPGNSDHPANTATLLTHLLLSQTSGRNLLRELLIFVAAWDLREEELYFKFMVKIMEAILENGLMPYAYHAFRDRSRSKDIISPAQAVIMKLLTCIFRGRSDKAKASAMSPSENRPGGAQNTGPVQANIQAPTTLIQPHKVDLHILNFIFTEFRQHIIPQTCALIFLQGQIHKGRASPEDFPLNLWDMERMYEGVYQYLEFFAVLTEDQTTRISSAREISSDVTDNEKDSLIEQPFSWKRILADWEMASELVTLLRELEGGIPKSVPRTMPSPHSLPPIQPVPKHADALPAQQRSATSGTAQATNPDSGANKQNLTPVAVERPFELDWSPQDDAASHQAQGSQESSSKAQQVPQSEASLAYLEESAQESNFTTGSLPVQHMPHEQDEPSDFEWRNLKKLTVLVLSSLIWKNPAVQDQVRKYGGLEALVGCCRHDEHNPYIREHSIMCLRFAVEGNEENRNIIRAMASRQRQARSRPGIPSKDITAKESNITTSAVIEDVPREVLDTNGYETFMDGKGQVGLRRKEQYPSSNKHTAPLFNGTVLSSQGSALATDVPLPQGPAPSTLAAAASSALSALQRDLGLLSASTAAGSMSARSRNAVSVTSQLTKMTAEKAAELMQSALRDLPLGDKLVTDRQKAEALARLDKAFESTEQALGKDLLDRGRKT